MDRLSFGLGPSALGHGTDDLRKELARLLRDSVGVSVRLVATRNYAQLYDQIVDGEVQVAWLPPAVFVRAHDGHAARLLAQTVHVSPSTYHGVLFVREDSPAQQLEDLRAKTAAWVDPSSSAGYLFPRLAMYEKGIDPRGFFGDEYGASTHLAVVEMVAGGTADVGATFCHVADEPGPDGKHERAGWDEVDVDVPMRAILRSRSIPNPAVCCSPVLPVELEERVTDALLGLHEVKGAPEILQELLQIRRFAVADIKDYQVVRAALNVTHSQLKRRHGRP